MIIGVAKKKRITAVLSGTECPFCKAKNSLVAEGFQRFFILGLPMFPCGKSVEIKCGQCKKFFNEYNAPQLLSGAGKNVRQRIKPAFWMFTFPLLVAILVPIALIKEGITASENVDKIKNARKGDVYTIEVGKRLYQKMKIEKVKGDSIWFYTSLHGPGKITSLGVDDIFEGEERIYTRKELFNKNDDHEIREIDEAIASPIR